MPDGKIRYDGINVNKIKKDDLRRSLSMVLQDTHLFTGTVRENIRYGKLDASDEEIERAAKIANADGFIDVYKRQTMCLRWRAPISPTCPLRSGRMPPPACRRSEAAFSLFHGK